MIRIIIDTSEVIQKLVQQNHRQFDIIFVRWLGLPRASTCVICSRKGSLSPKTKQLNCFHMTRRMSRSYVHAMAFYTPGGGVVDVVGENVVRERGEDVAAAYSVFVRL